jgi:hypothetical protein
MMARPATYNFVHYQGDTLFLPIRVREKLPDGSPGDYEDLTGCVATAQVRKSADDSLVVDLTVVINPVQSGATLGALLVSATDDQTALWPAGEPLRWDLQIVTSEGYTRTLVKGSLTVESEVTK